MKNIKRIGIIGAGNMGEALIARIGMAKKIIASERDKERMKYIKKNYKIDIGDDNRHVVECTDLIILAVKPKDIDEVLYEIRPLLKNKLLVSIAAGISTSQLEKIIGEVRVVRVMPNLACLVGFGISAISKGRFAAKDDINLVKRLFNLVGDVVIVKETLIDSITAVSGSGPAYYFLITEYLKNAGLQIGLNKKLAEQLAISTLYSSGRLIRETGALPIELIQRVASKGGTTEAALAVFKKEGLEEIILRAVKAARDRARVLSR